MAPPRAVSSRLGHIDNLRAVAALLVMWTHLAENFAPRARPDGPILGLIHELPPLLNLGHGGVVLFFCISGFVIYGSLARRPRENAGRRFALSRFFRLYPAYWVSLLLGLVVLWWVRGVATPWPMLAANAAMVSGLCAQPRVIGLYWTLEIELVFYALCWLLYRRGAMAWRATLPVLITVLLLAWTRMHEVTVWAGTHGWTIPEVYVTMPRHLAVMLWGALCREAYERTGGFRVRPWRDGRTLLAVALAALFVQWCAPDARHVVWRGLTKLSFVKPPSSVAYLWALAVFAFWVAGPRIDWRPLRWLGEISYSLYLFHPMVSRLLETWMHNGDKTGLPLAVYVLLGTAATVAISAAVYYAVERPAIRLGARLAEGSGRGEAEPVETPFETVAPWRGGW